MCGNQKVEQNNYFKSFFEQNILKVLEQILKKFFRTKMLILTVISFVVRTGRFVGQFSRTNFFFVQSDFCSNFVRIFFGQWPTIDNFIRSFFGIFFPVVFHPKRFLILSDIFWSNKDYWDPKRQSTNQLSLAEKGKLHLNEN